MESTTRGEVVPQATQGQPIAITKKSNRELLAMYFLFLAVLFWCLHYIAYRMVL